MAQVLICLRCKHDIIGCAARLTRRVPLVEQKLQFTSNLPSQFLGVCCSILSFLCSVFLYHRLSFWSLYYLSFWSLYYLSFWSLYYLSFWSLYCLSFWSLYYLSFWSLYYLSFFDWFKTSCFLCSIYQNSVVSFWTRFMWSIISQVSLICHNLVSLFTVTELGTLYLSFLIKCHLRIGHKPLYFFNESFTSIPVVCLP